MFGLGLDSWEKTSKSLRFHQSWYSSLALTVYADEVTPGGGPRYVMLMAGWLRIEADHHDNQVIRGLGHSGEPKLQGSKGNWRLSSIKSQFYQSCLHNETLIKILATETSQWSFLVGKPSMCQEVRAPIPWRKLSEIVKEKATGPKWQH